MEHMSEHEKPIGVFDSGIGGLTVVRALTALLPHENIIYFGDTARVPYGPKSPEVIREYAAQDTAVLATRGVKMVVVACNTVSAVALDVVRRAAQLPVIGMILPGAEAAVSSSTNKRIGVIGTAATIRSKSYPNAIASIDPLAYVVSAPCPLFVPLAEEGMSHHKATELIAKEYLFPLTTEKIDTLVLGCTHYPLLTDAISKATHNRVTLIDSGTAAAHTVAAELKKLNLLNTSTLQPNIQILVSDLPDKFSEVGERFLGRKLGVIKRIGGFSA